MYNQISSPSTIRRRPESIAMPQPSREQLVSTKKNNSSRKQMNSVSYYQSSQVTRREPSREFSNHKRSSSLSRNASFEVQSHSSYSRPSPASQHSHRSQGGSDGGSVNSAPNIRLQKELRDPASVSGRPAQKATRFRDDSPSSLRKQGSETSQYYVKLAKRLVDDLHKSSDSDTKEPRIAAITNACAEFDHDDEARHNIELQQGAGNVLSKILNTVIDEDVIRMVCTAIEMVFRAQATYVHAAFDKCGTVLMPNLLRMLERAENKKMKHADIVVLKVSKTLLYLSRVPELRMKLARNQGMIEAIKRVDSLTLNTDCRVVRTRIIANMVNCDDNKALLFEFHGLVDSLLRIAHQNSSDLVREYAGLSLVDLASSPANQIPMARNQKLLGTLVKIVLVEKVASAREYAITALQNIAFNKENRSRLIMFKEGIVLEALRKALSGDTNDRARRRAAGALTNLSCDDTAEMIGNHRGLLDTLAVVATKDKNKEVQSRAAMALTKLAASMTIRMRCHETLLDALVVASLSPAANSVSAVLRVKARDPENREKLARHPGILDTLADICISSTSDVKDKDNAMRALMHLTNELSNRKAMCNKKILEAMIKGASLEGKGTAEIRDSAIRAIERLATEFSNRAFMARHEGLLVAVAKATEREAKLEEAGAKPEHAFLAKALLMSLLVAM